MGLIKREIKRRCLAISERSLDELSQHPPSTPAVLPPPVLRQKVWEDSTLS
jgi:hypothetical protein